MKNLKINLFISIIVFFTSCQFNSDNVQSNNTEEDTLQISSITLSESDKQAIDDIINSIGPPLEFTYIIKDLDLKFSSEVLSSYDNFEAYNSSLDQAVAMGVYSADMVYCLIYNRTDLTSFYLESIQKLAESLNLTEVIDFDRLSDFSSKESDVLNMAMEFTAQMEKVHTHLRETDQLNLSAMMAFGGWIESIHCASVVGRELGSFAEESIDLIYYESIISQSFIEIFLKFDQLPGYEQTFKDLEELARLYNEFEVVLEKIEPEVTYSDSITQVINLSTQTLIYDSDQIDNLINQIGKIRQGVIK